MSNPKNSPFDNLQNEIAKEKFSALRRISENLSSCLKELESMSGRIDEAIGKNLSRQKINKMIETFNSIKGGCRRMAILSDRDSRSIWTFSQQPKR